MSEHAFTESIAYLNGDLEKIKAGNVVDPDNMKQLGLLVHITLLETCGKWMEENQEVTLSKFSLGAMYGLAEFLAGISHSLDAGTALVEQLVLFFQVIDQGHKRNALLNSAFPAADDPTENDFKLQ